MPSEPAQSGAKGRGAAFFASPGKWQKVSCHDEIVETAPVPVDGSEVSCHDETVEMTSKKQGTRASARQPKDAVPGDETVQVPQDFINGTDVTRIDFGPGYKAVLGCRKAIN